MNIDDATFVTFDVETTSKDPNPDTTRGIVEVAAVASTIANPLVAMWASLVNPEVPIPAETSAIHGLIDRDVVGADPWETVLPRLRAFVQQFSPITKASHHFEFDGKFLRTRNGLCTERLARHLWPDAPNYKNQTLRYWRGLEVETYGIAPHRALGDSLTTTALLRDLLTCPEFLAKGIDDTDALLEFCNSPILSPTMRFGSAHRDKPMAEVPTDYLEWMLRSVADLNADTRYTAEHELALRRLPRAS